jgi:hypothetical protein
MPPPTATAVWNGSRRPARPPSDIQVPIVIVGLIGLVPCFCWGGLPKLSCALIESIPRLGEEGGKLIRGGDTAFDGVPEGLCVAAGQLVGVPALLSCASWAQHKILDQVEQRMALALPGRDAAGDIAIRKQVLDDRPRL